MPWAVAAAGVSATGAITGGLIGANAASQASKAQASAATQALDWTKSIYGQAQQNFQPYITAGQSALSSILGAYNLPGGNPGGISAAYSNFQNTPYYQFPLQQANLATNRALAASGLTNSGGALYSLGQQDAGYASQGFSNYLGGLTGIATSGQNAVGGLASAGNATYQPITNAYTNIGNAGAQGSYNTAGSINSGISNALPFLTGNGQSGYGSGIAGNGGLISSIANLFNSGSPQGGDVMQPGGYYSNTNPNANF